MTQAELFDKCLLEIAVDVEAALREATNQTKVDDYEADFIHRNVIGIFEHNKAKYLRMLLNKPEEEPMTVLSAEIVRRQGATIKFTTTHKVKEGDLFLINDIIADMVNMTEKIDKHYFQAKGIAVTDNGLLKIDATETGYYAHKFDNKQDFDLRTIIGLPVIPIVDEETIKKVHEAACWC
jgi:hypothetical protein